MDKPNTNWAGNIAYAAARVHEPRTIAELQSIVRHAGKVVADHPLCEGRRQWITDRAHLAGLVGAEPTREAPASTSPPALLRPLAEYEAVAGGGW